MNAILLLVLATLSGGVVDTPEASTRVSFMAFGDWGVPAQVREHQLAVRDALRKFLRRYPVDCGLLLGDNFYPDGVASTTDPQWMEKFERVYNGPEFRFPFYATLGNHDYDGNVEAQWRYAREGTWWRMKKPPYSVTKGRAADGRPLVEFFIIDTCQWRRGKRYRVGRARLLESEMKKSRAVWKIVCGHHPVHTDREDRGDHVVLVRALQPVLRRNGAAMYLAGDHHVMELLRARRKKPADKTLYVVAGSGGRLDAGLGKSSAQIFGAKKRGFFHAVVSERTARIRFVGVGGKVVFDGALPRAEGVAGLVRYR